MEAVTAIELYADSPKSIIRGCERNPPRVERQINSPDEEPDSADDFGNAVQIPPDQAAEAAPDNDRRESTIVRALLLWGRTNVIARRLPGSHS